MNDALDEASQAYKKPRSDAHSRCGEQTGVEHAPPHVSRIIEPTTKYLTILLITFSGSHGGKYEGGRLLVYCAVLFARSLRTFQRCCCL